MIGFVGLGIMGCPMAKNLLKAGQKVMVSDLSQKAVDSVVEAGGIYATYAEIGAACDPIITCLPNGDIVQSVLFGENGIASGLTAGKTVCDMSSVTPVQSKYCYDKLKEIGVGFVDAPVSGGEPGAINATLAIMCGGDEADYEAMLPAFEILGSSSLLLGGPGAGSVCKLANQIIVNMNIATVSEAMVFAQAAGADPYKVWQAIRGGLAGSAVLDAKVPMMCARNFEPGGKISINRKDIKNVINTAHEIDVPVPFTAALYKVFQSLKQKGYLDKDHSALVHHWEDLAGIEIKSES